MFAQDVLDGMSALEFSEWIAVLFPIQREASTAEIEKALKASFGAVTK